MSYATLPPLPRPIRKVGAPLAAIIACGTVAALILILLTAVNPVGTTIGFGLSTLAMVVVLLCYLWLDRWEPEPPRLLIFAFLWGASVAIVVSVVLELLVESVVNSGHSETSFFTVAVAAPVIEEAAKGLFLLLMLTGVRRNELNSLTDCLVYAGVTAVGFAWIEDIFYIANSETLASSLVTAAMRLIMAPFAHPLFTTFTGIGVYFALQQRHTWGKVGCIALGFVGAVVMHALWNGSALVSPGAYFGLYLVWMMPVFFLAIVLAVRSRKREQAVVAQKLPGWWRPGWSHRPRQPGWGRSKPANRRSRRHAGSVGNRQPVESRTSPTRSSSWRSCGIASTAGSAIPGCSRCSSRRSTGSSPRGRPPDPHCTG